MTAISRPVRANRARFRGPSLLEVSVFILLATSSLGSGQDDLPCDPETEGEVCAAQEYCGSAVDTSPLIIGGEDVRPGRFPSFVQILVNFEVDGRSAQNQCGGVMVSDRWVLTAMSCLTYSSKSSKKIYARPGQVLMAVGSSINMLHCMNRNIGSEFSNECDKLKILTPDRLCQHPHFDGQRNDLALMRVSGRIPFDENTQPACWPFSYDTLDTGPTSSCYAIGWGVSAEKGPQKHLLQSMRVKEVNCPANIAGLDTVCTHPFDGETNAALCSGDVGGPVLCRNWDTDQWTVIGVTSSVDSPDGRCAPQITSILTAPSPAMAQVTSPAGRCLYPGKKN